MLVRAIGVATLFSILCCLVGIAAGAETARKTIWQGTLHLGDNPEQYSNVTSAGMVLQIPTKLDREKKGKLVITTRDIQTLLGEGHYAELIAHSEEQGGDAPANELVV